MESDADSCLNRNCPWFKKCFYHRAKQNANTADVIITNHSLLFTDMKAENRLLPGYKHLIIDEAHHFEEVASKHLGIELHYYTLLNTLLWLFKDSRSGQLSNLRFRLQKHEEEGGEKLKGWIESIDRTCEMLVELKEEWDQLTELLYQLLSSRSDPSQSEGNQLVFPDQEGCASPGWEKLQGIEEKMHHLFNESLKRLDRLMSEIKEVQEVYDAQSALTDMGGTVKELTRHRDSLHYFMTMPDENTVYWMEAGTYNKSRSLQLNCVPIDVSSLLQQYFFDAKDSVIMTSATLSVGKSFDYTCEQLGLRSEEKDGKLKTVHCHHRSIIGNRLWLSFPGIFRPCGAGAGKRILSRSSFLHWPRLRWRRAAACWCCLRRTGC
ncbi:hypothetical protein LJK87_07885 [Paenibacillus sp. P25]|nr:hypothetical protein LJK87_07885 [Paenibacillus sp. P25]